MKVLDIFLAFSVMLIWGASFSIIKLGLEELPPVLFIAIRFSIVAIPAIFFVPFPKTSIWNVVAAGALIGIIKFGLLFIAMRHDANAGVSSLIIQTQIFFTILLSYFAFGELITRGQFLGMMVAIFGFAFFFISTGKNITFLGLVLIIAAALAWAAANLVMKNLKDVNLFSFVVWMSTIPPIPLFIFSYFMETDTPLIFLTAISPQSWLVIAYMGYLSTLLAYAVWGYLLSIYPAATVTPFALLIPVFGILTAVTWLGERLNMLEFAGSMLVVFGLFLCFYGDIIFNALRAKK